VRRRPVSVGPQHIVGQTGEVRRDGYVFVNGELWRAHTADGSRLEPGDHVTVESVEGLTLTVGSRA
jgi:membrane protein implicated in regulation of membrane protease activity